MTIAIIDGGPAGPDSAIRLKTQRPDAPLTGDERNRADLTGLELKARPRTPGPGLPRWTAGAPLTDTGNEHSGSIWEPS
ncbi:MAG: hypothetical protein WBA66_13260 [Xanthobacteraceae bacterium]